MTPVRVGKKPFDDGRELDVACADVLEEAVELERIVRVEVVHHSHGVPFHPVLVEQPYAAHHLVERRTACACAPVFVVKLLRTVDGNAYEEVVASEKLAPLVGEKRAVGLQAVVYDVSTRVLTLQAQRFFVERYGAHERFASVPCEEHLRLCLRLDVLSCELFEQFVTYGHAVSGTARAVHVAFFCVITVVAVEVAERARRLQHDIERVRERCVSWHIWIV